MYDTLITLNHTRFTDQHIYEYATSTSICATVWITHEHGLKEIKLCKMNAFITKGTPFHCLRVMCWFVYNLGNGY